AARDWELDLVRSVMIGDKRDDVRAGAAAGCRAVLVRTGYGTKHADALPANVRLLGIADDLAAAVDLWLDAGFPLPSGERKEELIPGRE
ncbi:MAG: HAD hydrolase-like protein, partial [Fimbriiglobus sp.]